MKHKQHKHRHHSRYYQASRKSKLHLLVVPHVDNQYRPHLIRRYGLLAVAALVIGLQLIQYTRPYQAVLGDTSTVTPDNILASSNQARTTKGEIALRANTELTNAAKLKAKNMLDEQYWAHVSPSGVQPWHWLDEAGYHYTVAGENLAKNFATSDGVVKAWLASPAHRDNLLGQRFTDVGIAVARGELQGKATAIVVALYGAPATAVAAGAVNGNDADKGTAFRIQPATHQFGLIERTAIVFESLTPAAIISFVILGCTALVALMAHVVRHKLPGSRRSRWYRQHGLIKSLGLTCMAVVLVTLYAGGQL